MKKFIPVVVFAAFCAITYTSCEKKAKYNDINYCVCAYEDVNGQDSSIVSEGYGAQFSNNKAAEQCKKFETSQQTKYPGIKCQLN